MAAVKLLDQRTAEEAARDRMGRDRYTMNELMNTARRDKNDNTLFRILAKCGQHTSECPGCYDINARQGAWDSRNHGQTTCLHPAAVVARRQILTLDQERYAREGVPYHGTGTTPLTCEGTVDPTYTPDDMPEEAVPEGWSEERVLHHTDST